jgi:polyribonucleotide nucleotidyltransferase
MQPVVKTIQLADNRTITLETGKLAKLADGSVVVRMGNAMLLATVVAKKESEAAAEFLPLYVDYQEKFAAAGKIPGGFLKREGRLGDHEVLIARLVDRAIRPLFPKGYTAETQINISLISADEDVLPDALAALAASAALMVSSIPFTGPISEVRVARIDGRLCVNPTPMALERADIDMIVGATAESILMVEGEMSEVQEEEMVAAIQFAHEAIKEHCKVQEALAAAVGIDVKNTVNVNVLDQEVPVWQKTVFKALYNQVYAVAQQGIANKQQRKEAFQAVKQAYLQSLTEDQALDPIAFEHFFHDMEKQAVREAVLKGGIRLDGRKPDEVRPIWTEVDYLPAAHGSSIFTRGETQALATVTLGSKLDEQIIDRAMTSGYNKFMLHYNFPGFSTGEVKPNRGPSRREIGHGNLAMRALKKVLPSEEENPYTLRLVSDILESNGSSSMATVCASSMALMDAGVRIKAPVSGIAMGLVIDPATGNYVVLSDILGDEDHLGDMDFKVAGTQEGVTACQMDIKVTGLSYQILREALVQSRSGRLHILEKMAECITKPRDAYKPHVPRISTMRVAKDMIGTIIGPGGKIIQEIQRESGSKVLIEEVDGVGIIKFFAPNQEAIEKAERRVKDLIAEPIVGEVYTGKIKTIKDFGAFVEFMPGKDGLLHISEVKWERVDDLESVLEEGEEIRVKLTEIDLKTGKYRLSHKVLLPKPTGAAAG